MLRLLDFNNFFSERGGGIRTYHLRKLAWLAARRDVDYTLLAPAAESQTIEHGPHARIVYVRGLPVPGAPGYRICLNPARVRETIEARSPDLIEVGAPYVDPLLVLNALRHRPPTARPVIAGFWHAHYPEAYFQAYGDRILPAVGRLLRACGFWYARHTYGRFDAVFAASRFAVDALLGQGIGRLIQCPLGVDTVCFNPARRDPALRRSIGASGRPLVFFPHRLRNEKGLDAVLNAIPSIADRAPALFVFAGIGPGLERVQRLVASRPDCRYIGYVDSPDEMARWYASSDIVYALSNWETFGLSIVEAMASGAAVIAADRGAGADWISASGAGRLVNRDDVAALVNVSVELLQRQDLQALGARGTRFVRNGLSWDACFERQLACSRLLVDAHRRGQSLQFPIRFASATGIASPQGFDTLSAS